jgi:hypothetical protein
MKYLLFTSILFSINTMAQDNAPKPHRQEKKGPKVEQKCDCECHKDAKKHPRHESDKRPKGPRPNGGFKSDGSIR